MIRRAALLAALLACVGWPLSGCGFDESKLRAPDGAVQDVDASDAVDVPDDAEEDVDAGAPDAADAADGSPESTGDAEHG